MPSTCRDLLQLRHIHNRKFLDISIYRHTPAAILVYHSRTCLWLLVYTSSYWRALLSVFLSVSDSHCPKIIFAWNYSTFYNFNGCGWAILSERAAESQSNTFPRRHTPAWYIKMAVVTWPGDAELRLLLWVYSGLYTCHSSVIIAVISPLSTHGFPGLIGFFPPWKIPICMY